MSMALGPLSIGLLTAPLPSARRRFLLRPQLLTRN